LSEDIRANWLPASLPTYSGNSVPGRQSSSKSEAGAKSQSFQEMLSAIQTPSAAEDKVSSKPLKVSAHAAARMQERGVSMTNGDWSKLSHAVDSAEKKGAKDAYILYGQTGFVVNVPNRTIVTTMSSQAGSVVTNIDSVVVVPRLDQYGSLSMGTD
jgi:flagellar operon protein